MEGLDYRIITKKSAHQLVDEGILAEYIREGDSSRASDRHRLIGKGRNYTEAFNTLISALEAWNKGPNKEVRYGLCGIIELKERDLQITLRGDLVLVT